MLLTFLISVSPNGGTNGMQMHVRLALNTPDMWIQSDADRSPLNAVNNDAQGRRLTSPSQGLSIQWSNELFILNCHTFITLWGQTERIWESDDAPSMAAGQEMGFVIVFKAARVLKKKVRRMSRGKVMTTLISSCVGKTYYSCNLTHIIK